MMDKSVTLKATPGAVDETVTSSVLSPDEVIRSWLPDHTHVDLPAGPFNLSPKTTWTWSTTRGVWIVSWSRGFGGAGFSLKGPGARVDFGGLAEVALRQLRAVLLALDAIEVQR